jgi:putative transposase
MTYQGDFTLPTELLEQIASQGFDYLPELIRILVNAAMQIERQKHLGAGWHERTPLGNTRDPIYTFPVLITGSRRLTI